MPTCSSGRKVSQGAAVLQGRDTPGRMLGALLMLFFLISQPYEVANLILFLSVGKLRHREVFLCLFVFLFVLN